MILSKRLDRAVVNLSWRRAFPEAYLETLCKMYTNHHPILMRLGCFTSFWPKPFCFNASSSLDEWF